jgi:hypothetical protein
MKQITNWMQTKEVPPNRRHCCSKSQQQCHPRARAMNPQGWFQSVTHLPKPVNTQYLTGFSAHTTIQSTPALFYPACTTQENGPPSLPCSPSGCPPPSRAPVHLVKNLHVGTLRIRSCGKNLMHANASQTCMH